MFCTNCGAEILPGQTFCTNCGEAVTPDNAGQGNAYGNTGYANAGNAYGGNAYGDNYSNAQSGSYYNNQGNSYGYTQPEPTYTNPGAYGNGGYNTGINNTVTQNPKKMGTGVLAIGLCIAIVAGAYYAYTTIPGLLAGNKGSGSSQEPVVAYATNEDTQEDNNNGYISSGDIDTDNNNDKSNNESTVSDSNNNNNNDNNGGSNSDDSNSGDKKSFPASTDSYTTTEVDPSNSEFAEVDSKGYTDANLSTYKSQNFDYVTAYVKEGDYIFKPNGGLNGDTVFRDKKLSDFCDHIDELIAKSGKKLNRQLFYDVLAADLIDSSMGPKEDKYLAESLMYALSFAYYFDDMQVDFNYCRSFEGATTRYYYSLSTFGVDDIWMVDYSNRELYMNRGKTKYEPYGDFALFSDESYGMWLIYSITYFGLDIQ